MSFSERLLCKKLRNRDAHDGGENLQRAKSDISLTTLDRTDIRTVQSAYIRKLLLRKTLVLAKGANVGSQYVR